MSSYLALFIASTITAYVILLTESSPHFFLVSMGLRPKSRTLFSDSDQQLGSVFPIGNAGSSRVTR